jgi:hypothetical protein
MKTIKLLLAALCLSIVTSQADVAVWTIKYTETDTGGGSVSKIKHIGYVLEDLNATNSVAEIIDASGNQYTVLDVTDIQTLGSGVNKNTLVLLLTLSEGTFLLQGAVPAKAPNIGTSTTWELPTVFTITGQNLVTGSGPAVLGQFSGTASLDKADSTKANQNQLDFATALSDIETSLQNQGYSAAN